MKLAYADPPYLGCGRLYAEHHADALLWDDPETHRSLVNRLCSEYPDGWAMSLSSPSLRVILPMCPDDCRVAAWIKPFAAFKPNVNPAYAWEPVIFRGGRRGDRKRDTVQDFVVANITLKKGLTGAKPVKFCEWVLDLLGYERGDTLDDLFPGTGVMGRVLASSRQQLLSLEKAMTDDELVERFFPCAGTGCRAGAHDEYCPASQRDKARRLAAAVREAVMASAEVCRGRCGGRGHVLNSLDSVEPTSPCPTCSGRGILFGRGVVEGET